MPRRILFLTQWFDPEPIHKGVKFVRALQSRGYEVEVVTGFPNYPSGRIMPGYRLRPYQLEVIQGVRIHRIFLYPSHSRSSIGRAANYLSFFLSSLTFCLFRSRRFDAIYVYHPPITSPLAVALSSLVSRRPYIVDVQDLWPDTVAVSGMAGSRWMAKALGPVSSFVYRRAAFVVGHSNTITRTLVERGVDPKRAMTSFNWADEDSALPKGTYDTRSLQFEGRFNFVYGGNLGKAQGLETLVRAAVKASPEVPHLQLTLIGDGVEKASLEELVVALGATNVRVEPAIPQAEIGDVFAAADVLVLHLLDRPLFAMTIPSKTQFYMAAGRPILVAVKGETRDIVVSAEAGRAAEPGDIDSIAATMIEMARLPRADLDRMGRNAAEAYTERFSFSAAMDRIAATIGKVLA